MTYEEIIESARTINGLIKVYDFKGKNLEALIRAKFALEKQIPKKPILKGNEYMGGELIYDTWYCPSCDMDYEIDFTNFLFCPNCSQAIDWSE